MGVASQRRHFGVGLDRLRIGDPAGQIFQVVAEHPGGNRGSPSDMGEVGSNLSLRGRPSYRMAARASATLENTRSGRCQTDHRG